MPDLATSAVTTDRVFAETPSIGDQLVAADKLRSADLQRAIVVNGGSTQGLGPLLVRLGLCADGDVAQAYHQDCGIPLFDEVDVPAVPVATDYPMSIKFLKESKLVPLRLDDEPIVIALADPEDRFIVEAVEMASCKRVDARVATVSQIERALEQLYGEGPETVADIGGDIGGEGDDSEESIERLRDLAAEAPVIRLVNLIINRAIEQRASDIHVEPFEGSLKVRYRIDGVLHEIEAPPARSTAAVVSRIKIMANMNIAERRLPQDGRIQLQTKGKLIDLRVSTVPTLYGESVVLRILDKAVVKLELNTLGFAAENAVQLEQILGLPHGIILVTGPTGSGKTTTLYAAL